MKYFSTFEMAKKWGISPRRILNLIKSGRIPEAKFVSSRYMIPENLEKPSDGRTKSGKAAYQNKDSFRYPNFEFKDVSSFNPPLSKDELIIKKFIEAFNGFRLEEAQSIIKDLKENNQNRYIYITSLYCRCMLSIFLCDTAQFFVCYSKLKLELSKDFPHKAEMNEYLNVINSTLGDNDYYSSKIHNIVAYNYHESFLERLCNLSSIYLALGEKNITNVDLSSAEISCAFLEKSDNAFDLQALHIYLACAYSTLNKDKECNYHFLQALKLAQKYEMFYNIATMQYFYTKESLELALKAFPDEFKNKIKKCNDEFHLKHMKFTDALKLNNLYNLLNGNDYIYIVFALQGLSNKEVGSRLHKSENAISKHYSDIYASLNVKNKAEMLDLYRSLTNLKTENIDFSNN